MKSMKNMSKDVSPGFVSGDKLRNMMNKMSSNVPFLTQEQTDALLRPTHNDSYSVEQRNTDALLRSTHNDSHSVEQRNVDYCMSHSEDLSDVENPFEKIIGADNFAQYIKGCNELKTVYVITDRTTKDIIGIFKYEYMANKMLKHFKNCEIKPMQLDFINHEYKQKFTVKMLKEELSKYPDDLEIHIQYQDAGGTYEGTGNIYNITEENNHLVLS